MKSIFYPFFLCALLYLPACKDDANRTAFDQVLQQPPYNSITDSIKAEPKNAGLYFRRGVLLEKNNLPEAALADFRQAWSIDKKEEYAMWLGSLLIDKNPDSAIIFLQNALRLQPGLFLQLKLADAYTQTGKKKEALKVYDEILQQYPSQIDALLKKAELLSADNPAASVAALEKAYNLAPGDAELSYELAYRYAENKNPKVLALSDSLIRMDSAGRHAEPYYFKGLYYSNTGNVNQAITELNLAIRHDYNFLDAHMEKGDIYFSQKKYSLALKTFQLVLTISPSYPDAYFWIGKTQEAMGNLQDARLNYQRAYGLDKSFVDAKTAADKLAQ